MYPGSPPPRKIKVEIRPGIFHTIDTFSPGPSASPSLLQGNLEGKYGGAAVQNKAGRPTSAPMARKPPIPAPSPSRPSANRANPTSINPSVMAPAAYPIASILPPKSPGPPQSRPLPYQVDTAELAPQLAMVEEEMRRQIKLRAKVHITERVVLLRAFGKVLGKKDVEIQLVDKVTPEQLSAVWGSLGVSLSPQLAYAVFNKIGQDVKGRMPVLNFVDALLLGAPRQIMLENDNVQKGAYKAGKPGTHVGKIHYPQCKKGVWPPSDWDPRMALRSSKVPEARLKLEFVYGYDGVQGTAPNLFYLSTGEVAYVAAAIGVVYDRVSHTQREYTINQQTWSQ